MVAFAKALPSIRAAVARDLGRSGLPREKVLATVVSLLEATLIRVGNDEYARDNDSYGLTTLQEDHVRVTGDTLRFHFRGKSGREHHVSVRDKRLARVVRQVRDLPGQELFHYIDDDGNAAAISSHDVNGYLREISGDDFTAKDFRTWEGTLSCALALAAERVEGRAAGKARVVAAIAAVAQRLGNTPAVCKKSYIHPGVIDEFLANGALDLVEKRVRRAAVKDPHALGADESRVLAFIERLIARDEKQHLSDVLAKSVRRAKRLTRPKATRR
jgi:DNA topoisomerase-1